MTSLWINFLIYPQKHTTFFSIHQKQENISFSSSVSIYGSCQNSQLWGPNNPKEEESAEIPAHPHLPCTPVHRGHVHQQQLPGLGYWPVLKPLKTCETKLFILLHPPRRLDFVALKGNGSNSKITYTESYAN